MARSLWLVPPEDLRSRLASLIADLARRFRTPAFEPHVTLLGGIEAPEGSLLSRARSLAGQLRPFELRLADVGAGVEFFHCVFVAVVDTPELLQAHDLAGAALDVVEEPFRPHLSLVYGRLGDAEKRAARRAAGDLACAFTARELRVMDTSGDVEAWRRLAGYSLGPP
jgi:2'-5' RNA ligase